MNSELLQLKAKGLQLYYRILKIHWLKCDKKMRKLGDIYVKQEFRLHHDKADAKQYKQFYQAWTNYYNTLLLANSTREIARELKEEELALMTPEQKDNLKKLENETKKIR